MTTPEILKELELYTGRFPEAALKAAIEQREAITPELLRELENVANNPAKWADEQNHMLHLFAMFLLAQFREKRAYPLIAKIVSAPADIPYKLLGDSVTEDLDKILGSVYDGDPAILEKIIENPEVDEYVRDAAISVFLILENTGQMPREQIVDYFKSLFESKLERKYSMVWDGLACAVADLPAPELLPYVRKAYEDELVNPMFSSLEDIEKDVLAPKQYRKERLHLIDDTIADMKSWACFHGDNEDVTLADEDSPFLSLPFEDENYVTPTPYVREGSKIGRNDPCPCGSGKKYKKCCGK